MAVKTEKGSEVKDFTTDPVDSDKVLGFKNSDGARWWSLSRFWNWIKSKTASEITAGDKTPVNSDAVNGALANYQPNYQYSTNNYFNYDTVQDIALELIGSVPFGASCCSVVNPYGQRATFIFSKTNINYFSFIVISYYVTFFTKRYSNGTWID